MDRSVVLRGGKVYRPYSLFAYYVMAGKDIRLEYLQGKSYFVPKAEKISIDYSAEADSAVVVLSWEVGRCGWRLWMRITSSGDSSVRRQASFF